MSLDNIDLSPILLEGLFKNSLVELETLKKSGKTTPSLSINILGNNKSRIIIIIKDANNLYLPEDQLNFLMGILGACKLTMEDVGIININNKPSTTYKTIEAELKASKIILFGVTATEIGLPLEFPIYQIQQYNNQTYIAGATLDIIKNNKEEKIKLWNCLKQVFAR